MKIGVFERASAEIDHRRQFQLAGRVIDPQIRQVTWNNETIGLEPKSIELLFVLIAAAGRPVSRAELIEKVWRGAVVSDDAVQRAVSKLRRALADDTRDPEIIGTLPKSGYRLLVTPKQKQSLQLSKWTVGSAAALILAGVLSIGIFGGTLRAAPGFDFAAAKAITSSPGYELSPAMAPSGDLLAYVAYNDQQDSPSLDLLMLDRTSGETKILAGGPGMQASPVWAPDGKSLLYVHGQKDVCEIALLPMDGGPRRIVAPCVRPGSVQLEWGGDGQSILVLDRAAPKAAKHLYQLDLISGAREPLSVDVGNVQDMALSPRGNRLALVRERIVDLHDVYLLDLNTGEERLVTRESRDIEGISWSSDERSLVVSSDRAGLYRLWKLRIADGSMTAIAAPGMNASFPEIGSEFGPLVYQVWDNEVDLLLVGDGKNNDSGVAQSTGWEWSPSPSPDGRSIAYLTNRDGSNDVWIANVDGSQSRRVAAFESSFDSILSWSPNGDSIVLSALVNGRFSLVTVQVDTGSLEWRHHASADLRDPFFSKDGKFLYFVSNEGGRWTIRRQSAGEEGGEKIIAPGVLARSSTDDSALFIASKDGALDKYTLANGARETVVSARRGGFSRAWTPTQDGVAYLDGDLYEGYRLMLWDDSTNQTTLMQNLEGEFLESSALAQNSDGGIWIAHMPYCGSNLWEAPRIQ